MPSDKVASEKEAKTAKEVREAGPDEKKDASEKLLADAIGKPDDKRVKPADPKNDAKTDAKTDSKSDTKMDAKPDAKTDTKTDAKPDAKPDDATVAAAAVGVALPQLELIDSEAPDSSKGKRFSEFSKTAFTKIDTDNDGKLTSTEIDNAVNNQDIKGGEAQVVVALKQDGDKLAELNDDGGLTLADLTIVETKYDTGDTEVINLLNRTVGRSSESLRASDRVNYKLFASENPMDSIVPEAAAQGGIGDCYFISAISSTASTEQGRRAIRDMIQENNDGTYTVTFPGAPDEPITITRPTDAQLALYARGTDHGIWAAVLEKAYGEYASRSVWRRDIFGLSGSDIPQENVGNGSLFSDGVRMMSPDGVDSYSFGYTDAQDEQMNSVLTDAFRDGRSVTLGRNGSILESVGVTDSDNQIPRKHEYAVIGYDPETRMVTIRNPWGHAEPMDENGNPKDGKNDGVFQLTLEQTRQTFSKLSVGKGVASGRFADCPIEVSENRERVA